MKIIECDYSNGGKLAIPITAIQCIRMEPLGNKWRLTIYTAFGETTYEEFENKTQVEDKYRFIISTIQG